MSKISTVADSIRQYNALCQRGPTEITCSLKVTCSEQIFAF